MEIGQKFFTRDARIVAKELLGKYLVRRVNGKTRAYKILETESYLGAHDLASHARSGMTKRNFPMFGDGGHWYVYFTYGMHYMLNIVTGPKGKPSAVLIRAVEPSVIHTLIRANGGIRRGRKDLQKKAFVGPGRLTKQLKIDKKLNTKTASKASGLWIEDRGEKVNPRKIKRTARIGVAYAGVWAKKPFRFVLKNKS